MAFTTGAGVYFVLWVLVVHPADGVQGHWRQRDYEDLGECRKAAWAVSGMSRAEHMLDEPLFLTAICEPVRVP